MSNRHIAYRTFGNRKIILKSGDLTRETTDALVNAANPQLLPGGGVCGAIRAAAGESIFKECQLLLQKEKLIRLQVGDARMTGGGELEPFGVQGIIHAVGPQGSGEKELRSTYRRSLELAEAAGFQSIAFPSISTGIYGYPVAEAAPVAIDEVARFLTEKAKNITEVVFVFLEFDETSQVYEKSLLAYP